jgi:hypothetical protein
MNAFFRNFVSRTFVREDAGLRPADMTRRARAGKRAWVDTLEEGLFYFGVTLIPLLIAILAYQLGLL